MGNYQFSVEATLGFGSGQVCPPPTLKNSSEFMVAVHVLAFRVTAGRMDPAQVARVLALPRLSPQEVRIKEAWEKVLAVGSHVLSDDAV